MALEAGSRLGHYDVTALLGEGGMGQVWQATDTQLNRQVALKILPDAFAADPDRLARFTREAQILASLNHPNIAAIHGIEEAEGTRALVLELVEGPTLADRISQGAIPLDEALPIAKQIAEALEAAHEAGVIHRDLKPANIKVREDGTVKVLDFGLAKALDPAPDVDPSQFPTLTAAATQMGVILGTAAYMSPEQARGKPVDKRADIWAFGCVLYEMLTGQRVFAGADLSETLAFVITKEVDWEALPPGTPAPHRRLLARGLQRDPAKRLRDMGDATLEIDEAESASSGPAEITEPAGPPRRVPRLAWIVGPALVTGMLVALGVWATTRPTAPEVIRTVVSSTQAQVVASSANAVAITRDGRQVVYRGRAGGEPTLFVRGLDELGPRALEGLGNPRNPFLSPDGQTVGFFEGRRMAASWWRSGSAAAGRRWWRWSTGARSWRRWCRSPDAGRRHGSVPPS